MEAFKVGNHYSFSTYAPAILGQEHKRMLLMAVGNYQLASMFDNVDIKLNNIKAYLGDRAVKDPTKDTYLVFSTESGSKLVFGVSWINLNTLEQSTSQVVVATIDSVSASDAGRIREVLAMAGFNKVTTVVNNIATP